VNTDRLEEIERDLARTRRDLRVTLGVLVLVGIVATLDIVLRIANS